MTERDIRMIKEIRIAWAAGQLPHTDPLWMQLTAWALKGGKK